MSSTKDDKDEFMRVIEALNTRIPDYLETVTATVHNRSTEMVEAFYSVNRFGYSYLARWSSFCVPLWCLGEI
ncbi:hypothetical protein V6N13_034138 [Hibiscus sabdariffa]